MAKDRPTQVHTTSLPHAALSFDVDAFDQALRSQGVTFVHYRAMRCPVGMIDEHDTRRPHEDHNGCSNGFLYTEAGGITCLFTGNSTQTHLTDVGALDGSTVSVTLPRHYDGGSSPVFIAPFDRLYLAEDGIVVPDWQLVRADPTGRDKLNFPVAAVQDLVDARGRRYHPGDFEIRDGRICWTGSNRPGVDPETGRGTIYSVRYTYRPYWYVRQLIHEVRVSQAENPYTGERQVQRMPQAVVLQREYVFEGSSGDTPAEGPSTDPRDAKRPEPGRFGAR